MHRTVALVLCLLAVLVLVPGGAATTGDSTIHEGNNQTAVVDGEQPVTRTVETSTATDRSISGFTVGAAVIAVLVGGSYWHFRQ